MGIINHIRYDDVEVSCDYKISQKCRNTWHTTNKEAKKCLRNNNGNIICLFCSRKLKFSNRDNPNCKYKLLDDNLFKSIDNEYKSYLLGWIASDGNISNGKITIEIHLKDKEILYKIKDILKLDCYCKESIKRNRIILSICSIEMCKDICKLLKINQGPKFDIVQFPDVKEYQLAFIRGVFDGDGSIRNIDKRKYIDCSITSGSSKFLLDIQKYIGLRSNLCQDKLYWSGKQAINFLNLIYENAPIFLDRKFNMYQRWLKHSKGKR